jgi:ABC-type hemin transport system substrate-binding protein
MAGGNGHSTLLVFTRAPQRVVSLVPSITDTLIELGVGASLVGVTGFCRVPAELRQVRRGRHARPILPDSGAARLVMANQEENERPLVEGLEADGVRVWVTFPRSVREALDVLWLVVELFRIPRSAPRLQVLEATLEWTMLAAADSRRPRVFCPIWHDRTSGGEPWWMTFNAGAYAHDVLWVCGGENAFATRERHYPLEADLGLAAAESAAGRDTRYPCVGAAEVIDARPDVILLPDEPYPFGAADEQLLREALFATPAAQANRIHRVDGTLLTWHGTRLGNALADLPVLLQPPSG